MKKAKRKLYKRFARFLVKDLTLMKYNTKNEIENRITTFAEFNHAKNQLLNNITKHKKVLSNFRKYVLTIKSI